MFLDDLIGREKKTLNRLSEGFKIINENITKDPDYLDKLRRINNVDVDPLEYESSIFNSRLFLDILNTQAKLFLLDSLVVDSLYNVPHTNHDYEHSMRLPFPFVFFEFKETIDILLPPDGVDETPLSISSSNKVEKLRGVLIGRSLDFSKISEKYGRKPKVRNEEFKYFDAFLSLDSGIFGNPMASFAVSPSLQFKTSDLPYFFFQVNGVSYAYDPRKDIIRNKDENLESMLSEDERRHLESNNLQLMEKNFSQSPRDFYKILDLTINLINYINAQNVEIVRKNPPKHLDSINAKRLRKGKKLLGWVPTRPYYMIDVKKEVYQEIEKLDKGDKAWELNYRVWVRGYFYHYKDPIWGEKSWNM